MDISVCRSAVSCYFSGHCVPHTPLSSAGACSPLPCSLRSAPAFGLAGALEHIVSALYRFCHSLPPPIRQGGGSGLRLATRTAGHCHGVQGNM